MMGIPRIFTHCGRLADGLLMLSVAGLTFLLGCQELFDADVWWQLRAGRWILEHRAVPRVDPFTYGSAGRAWVDLHWLFQVALALAYEAGGVAGMIVLAASGATVAVAAGLALRRREWPAWIVAAAWIPGVLLASTRFDPRPEIVTLFGLAAFLGILNRARDTPGLLWLLVPVQLVWVNAHGLYILGPWTLGVFLMDRALAGSDSLPLPWRKLAGPSLAVGLVCFANPYGWRGVLLPVELFPKLTEAGGGYKAYIAEFMSPRRMVETYWNVVPGHDLYLRLFVFLLVALPLGLLVTAVGRAAEADRSDGARARYRAAAGEWAAGLGFALGLALAVAMGVPVPLTPPIATRFARGVPWIVAGLGVAAALLLARRSRRAAALAATGGGAATGWIIWLVGYLFDVEPHGAAAALAIAFGVVAAAIAVRSGTRLFGPLLAASFTALSLLSVRNMSLFGLVSGSVLGAELGAWSAELRRPVSPAGGSARGASAGRAVLIMSVWVLCGAVVTGRFFALAEDCHRFGLRERPWFYAHDACRFARGPGLPRRALIFGLNQAGVYEFHNAPARQVFMDGRLEVASRATFESYVQLHQRLAAGDARWARAAGRMGDVLILVDHEDNAAAEATLLADPHWRCIYQDAVAGIFLPRDHDRERERTYPTVDFAARHFQGGVTRAGRLDPEAARCEGLALARLGAVLAHRPVRRWSLPIPIALVAMDCARAAIAQKPASAGAWMVLAPTALAVAADPVPGAHGFGPAAPWDPALGLPWAQAAAAYRAAQRRDPGDVAVIRSLAAMFAMQGIEDARADPGLPSGVTRDEPPRSWVEITPSRPGGAGGLAEMVEALLRQGRPAAAVVLAVEAQRRGERLTWAVAERVAGAELLLGLTEKALQTWFEAEKTPSAALRATRIADTCFAAWNLEDAEFGYRRALKLDAGLSDAWVGLALTALERGQARTALEASRAALSVSSEIEPRRRALLEGIVALASTYAR